MFNGLAGCVCTNGKPKKAQRIGLIATLSRASNGTTIFDGRAEDLNGDKNFVNLQHIPLAFCQQNEKIQLATEGLESEGCARSHVRLVCTTSNIQDDMKLAWDSMKKSGVSLMIRELHCGLGFSD